LKARGGRTVMNLALFTYFIPAASCGANVQAMGVFFLNHCGR
jgi:hypothetical protein